jgi:hypothetical protein
VKAQERYLGSQIAMLKQVHHPFCPYLALLAAFLAVRDVDAVTVVMYDAYALRGESHVRVVDHGEADHAVGASSPRGDDRRLDDRGVLDDAGASPRDHGA